MKGIFYSLNERRFGNPSGYFAPAFFASRRARDVRTRHARASTTFYTIMLSVNAIARHARARRSPQIQRLIAVRSLRD